MFRRFVRRCGKSSDSTALWASHAELARARQTLTLIAARGFYRGCDLMVDMNRSVGLQLDPSYRTNEALPQTVEHVVCCLEKEPV